MRRAQSIKMQYSVIYGCDLWSVTSSKALRILIACSFPAIRFGWGTGNFSPTVNFHGNAGLGKARGEVQYAALTDRLGFASLAVSVQCMKMDQRE